MKKFLTLNFEVKKFQFNANAPSINYSHDFVLETNALRHKKTFKVEGLVFIWIFAVQSNKIEKAYYKAEHSVKITDKNLTDIELKNIIEYSYHTSQQQWANLILPKGLDAGFPLFDTLPIDLKATRKTLKDE